MDSEQDTSMEEGLPVELYIYDLTNGLASLLSPAILGRQIEGVWHTSVVVYEREYFYGGAGITSCTPGSTQLGAPHQVERLGVTFVPFQVFVDYIQGLAATTYKASSYHLLEHNCNNFTEEVAGFLCGAHVPKHILQQPESALPPPLRQALLALLDNLAPHGTQAAYTNGTRAARRDSPDYLTLNDQIEEARVQSQQLERRRTTLAEKLARKERRREKKRKKRQCAGEEPDDFDDMADGAETAVASVVSVAEAGGAGPSARPEAEESEPRRQEALRRQRDPPIVYRDLDGAQEWEKLSKALEGAQLSPEDAQSVDELQQYLVLGEGSWVLGDDFLAFVGRVLGSESEPGAGGAGGAGGEARVALLRCLAAAALREDVSLVLHQDRRHHALMSHAHRIDRLALQDQLATALFMCNLFENISSSEWLLYISEWDADGQPMSNIRATTKACVHALLSPELELRELGTALLHNIATKEVKTVVFDEVCVELAMAALQLLQWAPAEEHLFRAVAALARLAACSQEVPQLVALVGPDPAAFRGTSPRVDEQIDLIMEKVK